MWTTGLKGDNSECSGRIKDSKQEVSRKKLREKSDNMLWLKD